MKILFLGSSEFAVETLKMLSEKHNVALTITQPSRPAGRRRKPRPTAVATFARKNGLELMEVENVNVFEIVEKIRKENFDVAIVVAFGQILRADLLSSVKRGFFNVHASLLPKYRGAAPIQRALLDGVKKTGITLFKIDEGLDTGDIVLAQSTTVDPFENFDSLHSRLSKMGAHVVEKFLENVDIPLKPQHGKPSKAPKIKREEMYVDWSKSAEEVANKIRAFDSVPGARARLNEEEVKLFGVKGISMTDKGRIGEIVSLRGHALIRCGIGGVLVDKIQFPGKKVISFGDAQNGRKLSVGTIFGND